MKIIDVPQSILDLLRGNNSDGDAWKKLEELMKPLLPVMKFDADKLLPSVLRERCVDIAYRMQCPIDFVAVSSVCMLGAVIGAGCAVRPKQRDDWTEVPNLWGGVVARPGKLKTPAISEGLSPLRSLEKDAQDEYQSELASYNIQQIDKKMQVDFLKRKVQKIKSEDTLQSSSDLERLRKLNQPSGDAPKLRRYRTNDSTVEKLGESLAGNARGMLVDRDELIGLLKSFEQQGHEGDRTFYLEGWNGRGDFRIDRIGRGEIYIPHLCIAVFGGIQPAKLQEYLFDIKQSGNDGFLQRFQLVVYPDDIENPQVIDQAPNREAKERLTKIVRQLATSDFESYGAARDYECGIPYFRFDDTKAQPLFFKWMEELDQAIAAEDDPIIAEHLAKYRKLVPALALIFHLFEHMHKESKKIPSISIGNLKIAIAWSNYLLTHARRIYSMGLDLAITAAEALARKIKGNELLNGFSERDVYRAGWANLNDKELVRAACQELEAAGWIRRRQKKGGAGRPPAPAYDINPAVKK